MFNRVNHSAHIHRAGTDEPVSDQHERRWLPVYDRIECGIALRPRELIQLDLVHREALDETRRKLPLEAIDLCRNRKAARVVVK